MITNKFPNFAQFPVRFGGITKCAVDQRLRRAVPVLIHRVLFLMLFLLGSQVMAIQIGDRVKAGSNGANCRTGAGTNFALVPGSPVAAGALGVVMSGPSTGSNLTWYVINWDDLSQDGYSATTTYTAVVPDKPATTSPGGTSAAGQTTITTVTPTFQWTVAGATHINVYIRDTGTNVLQNFSDVGSIGGNWTIPAGKLQDGHSYKWNMQASNSIGDSLISNDRYFKVDVPTGTIHLTVKSSTNATLPKSEINGVLLFNPSQIEHSRQQPPSANPMDFTGVKYGDYYYFVFCWDMLAAESGTFSHAASTTNVSATTYAKRPLSVYAFCSDGNTPVTSANVILQSWNGESLYWTDRASGTTDNSGKWTVNAWPTTLTEEKYRILISSGGTSVGSDDSVTVPNTASGRTIGVTTTVLAPAPTVTKLVPSIPNPTDDVVPAISGQQTIDVYGTGFVYSGAFNVRVLWKDGLKDLATSQIVPVSSTNFQILINVGATSDTWAIIVTNKDGQVSAPHYFTAQPYPVGFTLQVPTYSEPSGQPQIDLTWIKSNYAEYYDVLRDNTVIASGESSTSRTYSDTSNLTRGQSYTYRIRAGNGVGTVLSNAVTVSIPADTSPHVTVTSPNGGISWPVGAPLTITWTLTGVTTNVNYFKVAILDNGVEDPNMNFAVGLTGRSHTWTPPSSFIRANVTIRVRALDAGGNILAFGLSPSFSTVASGAPLAIIDPFAPVALQSPASFIASHSVAVSGRPITSYHWIFSDGGSADGPVATHTFAVGTEGTAQVTVSDGVNASTASVRFPLRGVGSPDITKSGASLDPVNTATGNFVMNRTLLAVSARGLPFVFQAFYNSKTFEPGDTSPGPLGFGWTHNFETHVTNGIEDGVRNAIVSFGDGHREKYQLIGTDWTAEPGIYNTLTEAADGSFTLTSQHQLKSQFDLGGRLIAVSDRNSNTLTVVWNAPQTRIESVILPGGPDGSGNFRKILFGYDETTGHLKTLTDPIGRVVEFTVNSAHDLITIKNPRQFSTNYTYDSLHQLLTGTDARSHVFVENEYSGRVVTKQYDADRNVTTFDYPFTTNPAIGFTRITRVVAPDSEITEDYHNSKLQLEERRIRIKDPTNLAAFTWLSEKYEYDPLTGDRVASVDRNGNRRTFQFTNGNLIRIDYPDAGFELFEYDVKNNPTLRTNALGVKEKWDYDSNGNIQSNTFPYDPTAPAKYKRMFTVDSFGQTTAVTDANGNTTHAYFNEWGENWKVEDAEIPPNSKTFDFDRIGRVTGVTDERANHTTFVLNPNGGIETTTLPDSTGPKTINQVFDQNDNRTSIEDQLHRFNYFDFDNQDRQFKTANHLLQATVTQFDTLGRAVAIEDPKHNISQMKYDLAGRLIEAQDQEGRKHTYTTDRNGNVLTDTDEDDVKLEYKYDSMNRRTTVLRYKSATEFDESTTHYNTLGQVDWTEDAKHQRTSYFYNDAGQMTRLVDAKQQEFTWTYDFEGHLLSASHPSTAGPKTRNQTYTPRYQIKTRTDENGKTEQFFYDAAGNLDHLINADDQTVSFAHDSLNRLSTVGYPNGPPVQFTYDAAGQRLFMDDPLGRTAWTYTLLGQVETSTDPFGKQLSFGYDVNGNRDTVIYPGNNTAHYTFDKSNLLLSVTDWQDRTINHSYTPGGRVSTITYPNGVITQIGHDGAGRENDIQHQKAPAVPFIDFGYHFDELGDIDQQMVNAHPLPRQFSASTTTNTYDAANQLLTIDGLAVTHDNRGNLLTGKLSPTSSGTDSLTWDYDNRLVGFTIAGIAGSNRYNGLGHRLESTHGSDTKRFVVDGTGSLAQVMAETDGSGTIKVYYLYGTGLAARILTDGTVSYYHMDRSGNVLALTDDGGSVSDLYRYDEFGDSEGSSGSSANPFRYLGGFGVYDNGDGTLFARARHYHPDLGRFLSRDPLIGSQQNGQSLNRYVYALNDPMGMMDVTGLSAMHSVSPSFYTEPTWITDGIILAQFWQDVSIGLGKEVAIIVATEGLGEVASLYRNAKTFGAAGKYLQIGGEVLETRTTTVYSAVENGITRYVGITDNLPARALAHMKDKGIFIEAIPGLAEATRTDARAVEQALIEFHGLGKNGGPLINKINSIAETNPIYSEALSRGTQILKDIGYPGF